METTGDLPSLSHHVSGTGTDSPDLTRGLQFLWLEITEQCNLNCVHCYADSGPSKPLTRGMMYDDWRNVMVQAVSLGCSRVQFIGGEPTVHPDFSKLIVDAQQLGFEFIEVYTNGTRLTDDLCKHLSEYNVRLAVSFYGSRADVHDSVTLQQGSFAKTISGIERALAHDIPIRVGIISMSENLHELEETKKFLESRGVTNIGIDRLRGIGRGGRRYGASDPAKELCGACWQGKLAVDSAGNVSPCVFSHFHDVGHISEGLKNILDKPELLNFRLRVRDQTVESACNPPECNPWCFPSRCDPERCNPINCSPLDFDVEYPLTF